MAHTTNEVDAVLADELERDGRVMVEAGGRRVTVRGFNVPVLEGSASQVTWARDIRAQEVRGVLVSLAEKGTGRAMTEADVLGLSSAVQAVLALPAAQHAGWWLERRTPRGTAPGMALRDQVRRVFRPGQPLPEHLSCTIEAI